MQEEMQCRNAALQWPEISQTFERMQMEKNTLTGGIYYTFALPQVWNVGILAVLTCCGSVRP